MRYYFEPNPINEIAGDFVDNPSCDDMQMSYELQNYRETKNEPTPLYSIVVFRGGRKVYDSYMKLGNAGLYSQRFAEAEARMQCVRLQNSMNIENYD